MVVSKRERCLATAVVLVVAVFVLDRFLLTPFMNLQAQDEADKQSALGEMERATSLFALQGKLRPEWDQMLAGGLKRDAFEAESQVLRAVRNWSQEAGLALSSVKPERVALEGDFQEIIFQAAGTGPMKAVARFLWLVETTSLPLRIEDLQLGSRTEGRDDLSLQLRISTLYLAAEAGPSMAVNPAVGSEEVSQ